MFDVPQLADQFVQLFECGFIPKKPGEKRASISLEVRPYPGATGRTSIQLMYEKAKATKPLTGWVFIKNCSAAPFWARL